MRVKTLLPILLLLFSVSELSAQFYGMHLGAGMSSFKNPTSEVDPRIDQLSDYHVLWSTSVSAGFMLIEPINSAFSVETGLNFVQKGSREEWEYRYIPPRATDSLKIQSSFDEYRQSYIELPLLINHDKSGFYGGFLLSKIIYFKFQRYLNINHYYQNKEVFRRTDVDGYDGGPDKVTFVNPYEISWMAGYKYHLQNYMHLSIGVYNGLTTVFKPDSAPWLNYKTVEVRMSVRYFFNAPGAPIKDHEE